MTLFPGTPAFQDPDASGFWDGLWAIVQRPGVMETLVLLPLLALLALVLTRALRMASEVRRRGALTDYLLGVEQALSRDLSGARKRLSRVLGQDPENHYARLLYGVVLAELGETAEAHKQHLYLKRAFRVQSSDNDLALARSLMTVGRPGDAVIAAQRSLAAAPEQPAALRVLFRAQLAAGLPADAGRTGERLARLLPPDEQTEVRRRAASALAQAGAVHLRSGSRDEAEKLCRRARELCAELPDVRRLHAGLEFARLGSTRLLGTLAEPDSPAVLPVPAGTGDALVRASDAGGVGRALTSLLPASRRRCTACQGDVDQLQAVCPHCGTEGRIAILEPALYRDVESATLLMDDIDETRAHVQRLIQAAGAGNAEARDDLVEMGDKAVEQLLAAAIKRGEDDDAVLGILQAMGPGITPALFKAYDEGAEPRRALPAFLGGRSSAGVVGRIVQGFGKDALPHFEGLLETDNRDLRKITIDFFIGLADSREFQRILDRFPPMEVLHRLNKADRNALIRFLAKVEPNGFVTGGLLPDPAFYRDAELFEAIASADHPDELQRILKQRGCSRSLALLLIGHLGGDPLSEAARELLQHFGVEALDHMLAAFTDPDCPDRVRTALQEQIARIGAAAVQKICACFGPRASTQDADLERLLHEIGTRAVPALERAYEQGGLLEYLGGLVRGHNRRERMIRALAGIGGQQAYAALERLRQREKDADLKLRLSRALHGLESQGHGPDATEGHGQAG